jgi:hypothetical protein
MSFILIKLAFYSMFFFFGFNDINFIHASSELEGCAVQMVEMYCKSLPLSKDLDPQESMHGEELLSMVCNVLVQVSQFILSFFGIRCVDTYVLVDAWI